MTRYAASDRGSEIVIRSWTGFQKLIYPNKNIEVSEGYLPPITVSATKIKVIFSVINRSLGVMTELNLKNIILEVEQTIYTKILDVMFRMELEGSIIFDKIISKMGGFHIVICIMKTMCLFMCLFFFNYCMYLIFMHYYYMHLFLGFKLSFKCFCFFKIF